MNKNELEFQKLQIRSVNFRNTLQLIKHVFTVSAIIACVYLIFGSLKEIVSASPASVNALALLAEKLNVSTIIGYLVAVGTSSAWVYERKGNKRLVQQLGEKRKAREQHDAYRGSSGLTETGDTPSQ